MTTIDSSNDWWNIVNHVKYHAIETTSNSQRVEMFAKEDLLDKCEYVYKSSRELFFKKKKLL